MHKASTLNFIIACIVAFGTDRLFRMLKTRIATAHLRALPRSRHDPRRDPLAQRRLARRTACPLEGLVHGNGLGELARGAPVHDRQRQQDRGGHGAHGQEDGWVDTEDVRSC